MTNSTGSCQIAEKFSLASLITAMLLFTSAPASCEPVSAALQLEGIWKAENYYGPEIQGRLEISRLKNQWQAEISNYVEPVASENGEITFEIPGSRGNFRGHFVEIDNSIVGHWIQPPTSFSGVEFASPLKLMPTTKTTWSGEVRPLQDKMDLFISIKPAGGDNAQVVVLNPQTNFGRFIHVNRIEFDSARDCDNLRFFEIDSAGKTQTEIVGTYRREAAEFSIYLQDFGGTFDFSRVLDSNCAYFPRPLSNPPYSYSPPLPKQDGWEVGTLADVKMAEEPIEQLIQTIISNTMDSIDVPYIHALLIVRHGTLVAEEYFHGFDGETPHDTRSASKSMISTLVGAAINAGEPVSLMTRVYETMYGGHVPSGLDPRAGRMTLEHLLTMSSGLACDDGNQDSPGNEDVMQNQTEQPDWGQYILDLPMKYEPGEHAAYCSGGMSLAGEVLTRSTGKWLPDLFQQHFAEPLSLGLYHMNLTPVGEGYGGGGLRIKARDFLKLGQIMLDDGKWNGRQIVSEQFASEALEQKTEMWGEGYGLGWWLIEYPYKDRTVKAFYAGGNGGQYIIGVPEFGLLVLFYGGNYSQRVMHVTKRQYVPEFILKSVELGAE